MSVSNAYAEQLSKQEQRSYDRAMSLQEENSALQAVLRDIASCEAKPTAEAALAFCVSAAKTILKIVD